MSQIRSKVNSGQALVLARRPQIISGINGIWSYHREKGVRAEVKVPKGHLFHYVTTGRFGITIAGRSFTATKGDLVYYEGGETVATTVGRG